MLLCYNELCNEAMYVDYDKLCCHHYSSCISYLGILVVLLDW